MVLSWDTRHVGWERCNFFGYDPLKIPSILHHSFPNLRCLLLDRQVDLVQLAKSMESCSALSESMMDVPEELEGYRYTSRNPFSEHLDCLTVHAINVQGTSTGGPLMLSLSQCQTELPASFFTSSFYLRNLVYLDVSFIPGLVRGQLEQVSLTPANLPCLRILKARGGEIDDATAVLLFRAFKDQLWSLDLGRNRLSDGMIGTLISVCFPDRSLRSATRFEVEGRVAWEMEFGSDSFGPFQVLEESYHSALFNHPLRYFADAPAYTAESHWAPQEAQVVRCEGRADIVNDSIDWAKEVFMDDKRGAASLNVEAHGGGLSHLHLDDNDISDMGLQRLVNQSPGQLQSLELGSVSLPFSKTSFPRWMGDTLTVSGCAGLSHIFRPVFSPNLQALSIHHSLVTNVLSIETGRLGTMADTWLSEKFLFPSTTLAYPLPFVPDMNPRLFSLALTGIPRYSCGPIIEGLISLLKRASEQERAIEEAKGFVRRGPSMLRGLRQIRLEFQYDASEELINLTDSDGDGDEIDSELLASMAAKEFSFFGDDGWASRPPTLSKTESNVSTRQRPPNPESHLESDRRTPPSEFLIRVVTWNGRRTPVPVWIGPGVPVSHPAVNAYMRRLSDPGLLTDIVPASPCHLAAGVPPHVFIFSAAWTDIATRPNNDGLEKPTKADLDSMQDVVVAMKAFRAKTKRDYDDIVDMARCTGENVALGAPHFHWTGRLEVSLPGRPQPSK